MNKLHKMLLIGFVVGFFVACVSIGAKHIFGISSAGHAITCSTDGKYVYMIVTGKFSRSEDYGQTFTQPNPDLIIKD